METLIISRRGTLDELYHTGSICVVDNMHKIIYSKGDINQCIFMRSTAKVFQILPLLYYDLDIKYQLTLEEIAIMMSSHIGSVDQIRVIKQIMSKTGINESDFCIKPAYPTLFETTKDLIKNDIKPSPIYHMCAGKHLGLMLVEKEFDNNYQNYYLLNSNSTRLSCEFISKVALINVNDIVVGLDGCGVPVFGITLFQAAVAFQNLIKPRFSDEKLNECIKKINQAIEKYPDIIRGKNYFCSQHNYDVNILAKDGAQGYYAFGMKNEELGIAFKVFSGDTNTFGFIVAGIYQKIGYDTKLIAKYLNYNYTNDNDEIIGEHLINF